MKISELIKNLQTFLEDNDDMEAWYSKDDEGNEYQPIYYTPSVLTEDEDGKLKEPVCCIN